MASTELPSITTMSEDIAFLGLYWPDLAIDRSPGTARPWRQSSIDPDARHRLAELDRLERQHRDPDAPGFSPAAVEVLVLDVMVEIWALMIEMAKLITPPIDPSLLRLGPTSNLRPLINTLHRKTLIGIALEHSEKMPGFERRLASACGLVTRTLSLIRHGQLLGGAMCPWCKGATPKRLAGGATTMRIEEIAAELPATADRPMIEGQYAVVCWNPLCSPPETAVHIRYFGFPAWPTHQWEWLSTLLLVADPPARITLLEPVKVVLDAVEHSGRTGLPLTAHYERNHDHGLPQA